MIKYPMNSSQYIKQKFIDFFKDNGHFFHTHSPLAPSDYDTTMFTIAGMKQFTDYFLGTKMPEHKKMITIQPCIRVNDLNNVGKTSRHLTFFEMIGNFSFGAYFKQDVIKLAYEFLINILKLDITYLYFTVFHEDAESYNIWKEYVSEDKIIKIATDDNFWRAGQFGPCGPCSEIYFDTLMQSVHKDDVKKSIESSESRFLEIWNLVFMQYDQQKSELVELPLKCVDTGMSIERISSVYDKTFDVFKTDLLKPIYDKVFPSINNEIHSKIVSDHLRSIVFLIGEGLKPSNTGQGYVLRNLIRRSVINAKDLYKYVDIVLECLIDYKNNLLRSEDIQIILKKEEEDFKYVLQKGIKMLDKCTSNQCGTVCEETVFHLYDTYGMPIEILKEILFNRNININWEKVEELKKKHSEVSKKKLVVSFDIPTEQENYDILKCKAKILYLAKLNDDMVSIEEVNNIKDYSEKFIVITDKSCFYARGGGQEGDQGIMTFNNKNFNVIDTIKQKISNASGLVLHICNNLHDEISIGDEIDMEVNKEIRDARTRAHSAIHIFGEYFTRKYNYNVVGSFVGSDYFRVDFETDRDNLRDIIPDAAEYLRKAIRDDLKSCITYEKFENVQGALSGDRCNYDEIVQVVDFPGFSKQLCGGTHVKNVKDIIGITIVKECSKKSGIRRIEAFVGNRISEATSIA